MWNKKLSILLIMVMLTQLLSGVGQSMVHAHSFTGGLSLQLQHSSQKVVLGKSTTVTANVINLQPANGDWAYNLSYELLIPDGLEFVENVHFPASSVESIAGGMQKVVWRDIKDLAPQENYAFTVDLASTLTYRTGGANVDFGDDLNVTMKVIASDDARQLPPAGGEEVDSISVEVTPFEIKVNDMGKAVKGAGPDDNPPASGEEWGAKTHTIQMINNERSITHLSQLLTQVDASIEVYDFSVPYSSMSLTGGIREVRWDSMPPLAAGETRSMTFDAAFLEHDENGIAIQDGTIVSHTLSYDAMAEGQPYSGLIHYTGHAKDIIISKSVSQNKVAYGDVVTYTLSIKTNEYIPVDQVVVTDILGDGHDFVQYVSGPQGTPINPVHQPDGTTVMSWNLGTLQPETLTTLSYEAEIRSDWVTQYGQGPIYAADQLNNQAQVTGETTVSGTVSDSASTSIHVNEPEISEEIAFVNSQAIGADSVSVTVGDVIDIELTYDASTIGAKQHEVTLYNFLPLGTELVSGNLADYAMNGVTPTYEAADHLLIWELGDLSEATGILTTMLSMQVQNSQKFDDADKGSENLYVMSFANSPERIESRRASVELGYVEPVISIDRKVKAVTVNPGDSPVQVIGGETVLVSLTLTNTGATTAYDVDYAEVLPPEVIHPVHVGGNTYTQAGNQLNFDRFASIAPGASVNVQYQVDVVNPIGAGYEIDGESSANYTGLPQSEPIYRSYVVTENQHVVMKVQNPTITKTVADTTTGNTDDLRIGDWVVYQIQVTLPTNVEAYNPSITDTIPNRQSYMEAYTSYSPATDSGVSLPGGQQSLSGNQLEITGLVTSPGAVYTYFVKNSIDDINGTQLQETQRSRAEFDWQDAASSGTARSVQSANAEVTVLRPNLTVSLTPASVQMGQGDETTYTFQINNVGRNTAYEFTPYVTIPAGFEFVAPAATLSGDLANGYTMTYPRTNLSHQNGSNQITETFTVRLVELKSAGSTFAVRGYTGDYYATPQAYANDTDGNGTNDPVIGDEKYNKTSATANITAPNVTIQNEIIGTSNGSSLTEIRPGDTVDYRLTVTVPQGTKAYDLTIEDTFATLGQFEVVSTPADGTWAGQKLTVDLGDAASGETDTGPYVLTRTVQLRALADGSSPISGSFQQNRQTHGTSAVIQWAVTDGGGKTSSPADTTSVDVIQPSLSIQTIPLTNDAFSSTVTEIEVGYTVRNAGASTAHETMIEVPIPDGVQVVAGSISSDGGVSGNKVIWTGLTIPGQNGSLPLTFRLEALPELGAGAGPIPVIAELVSYTSKPTAVKKTYVSGATAQHALYTVQPTMTATIQSHTNSPASQVRPGDEITYQVTLDVPDGLTVYHPTLQTHSLTHQDVLEVRLADGTMIYEDPVAGGYDLPTASVDQVVFVKTRMQTTTSMAINPYIAVYEPRIDYQTALVSGSQLQIAAAAVQSQVAEPDLAVSLSADGTVFTAVGDTITYTVTVDNHQGVSTAYAPGMTISVTDAVYVTQVQATDPLDTATHSGSLIHWSFQELAPNEQKQMTFTVTAKTETAVGTGVDFQATLEEYFSRPVAERKTYGPLVTNQVNSTVRGNHVLDGTDHIFLTAGNSASFDHLLTNTGAGRDTFILDMDAPYPTDVYINGQRVASGHKTGGLWSWTMLAPAYDQAGAFALSLDGGEQQAFRLVVQVPEQTPFDLIPKVMTVGAAGQLSTVNSQTQDRMTVIGPVLDGWTGSTTKAGWSLPNYGTGDIATYQAVSAVHIQQMQVKVGAGTDAFTLPLMLLNPNSYIQDGEKRWLQSEPLPQQMAAATYDTTFIGLDQVGTEWERDEPAGAHGANNPLQVYRQIDLEGHITHSADGNPIEQAVIELRDRYTGQVAGTTTSDMTGYYTFVNISVGEYVLHVEKDGYSEANVEFYALPANGTSNKLVVNAQLSPYQITLTANPETLLGDGISETILTATISDLNGQPLQGVEVEFSSPTGRGTFPSGVTAVTDANGQASVPYRSEAITGSSSIRFPVAVEVDDPVRQLHAKDEIYIVFEPGAITGLVTEVTADGRSVPVAGANILITKDFDGDGTIDFTARAITKADGTYFVAVPQGNTEYDVQVTKTVRIGNEDRQITFPQKAQVGVISVAGFEVYPSVKTGAGVVFSTDPNGASTQYPAALYQRMTGYLLDQNGQPVTNLDGSRKEFPIEDNGSFHVEGIEAGNYQLVVLMQVDNGEQIIINEDRQGQYTPMIIQQNGEINITEELIDPYGTITDFYTGDVIEQAHVELYYADTARNITNGRVPGTMVILPELLGFDPNDNHNPQDSDVNGFYAYMVYGFTDYYLVVTKPGYYTYTSPTISVEEAIVRHDLKMKPIRNVVLPEADLPADLAVEIFSDRAVYAEGDELTFTIKYRNRSAHPVRDVHVQAQIPAYTVVKDAAGGIVNGQQIRWELGDLDGNETGELIYKVQAIPDGLPSSEVQVKNEALIQTDTTEVINPEDDRSSIQVMVFSSRYGAQTHTRYIVGYPDGEFKLVRNITRAEIAAIFARIMALRDTVTGDIPYSDVSPEFWAAEYIEAVSKAGLFTGYQDGTFQPNKAITRAELSVVISKYLELANSDALHDPFTDTDGHWAENYIAHMVRHHIIVGYPDGTFKPNASMVRVEAVTMINRLLNRGPLNGAEASFPDVSTTHWGFGEVEESTRTHQYERHEDGSEHMTEFIPEPLW
ncbi:S-layer homology domain-containing protein [Marinicrinis sediminis]|uniref:S-layer homology domain-containing protein n=1 Tax=Marinicrinis sediminis TaxID=1652465 RepID=A0ABW5REZ6_9BACL